MQTQELRNLLIRCLMSKEIGLDKYPTMAKMSILSTKSQVGTMIAWIEKHQNEEISEERLIKTAKLIAEKIRD